MDFQGFLEDRHKEPSINLMERLNEINHQSHSLSRLMNQYPLETKINILAQKQDLMLEILTIIYQQENDQ